MLHNVSPLSIVGDGDRPHVAVDDYVSLGAPPADQNGSMFQLLCYQVDS